MNSHEDPGEALARLQIAAIENERLRREYLDSLDEVSSTADLEAHDEQVISEITSTAFDPQVHEELDVSFLGAAETSSNTDSSFYEDGSHNNTAGADDDNVVVTGTVDQTHTTPPVATALIPFSAWLKKQAKEQAMAPLSSLQDDPTPHVPAQIFRHPLGPHGQGWPVKTLSVELFERITSHLPRDDVKTLRLINKEFEAQISGAFFRNIVVPFSSEIYSMLESTDSEDKKKGQPVAEVSNETGTTSLPPDLTAGEATMTNKLEAYSKEIYRPSLSNGGLSIEYLTSLKAGVRRDFGMKIFQGFGPHVRRFGMSFEVDEEQLRQVPEKVEFETQTSFWGMYQWPPQTYRRFKDCAGLEYVADETSSMKTAFSNLSEVTELAISVDNKLGFLSGPDISERIFAQKALPPVFGRSMVPDSKLQKKLDEWVSWAERILANRTSDYELPQIRAFLRDIICPYKITVSSLGYAGRRYANILPLGMSTFNSSAPNPLPDHCPSMSDHTGTKIDELPLRPNNLTGGQQDWLLETEWAQRAFLTSYCIAVIDNGTAFQNVHTFSVARLSSRHVPLIGRRDFWDALPNLKTISLGVIPDWRDVYTGASGKVMTPSVDPSDAILRVAPVLFAYISRLKSVKTLKFGWVGGGECAEGTYSRNQHILAAPIVHSAWEMFAENDITTQILELPHVEHLTLSNCWASPQVLASFIKGLSAASLKTLTMDSVSLTAVSYLSSDPPIEARNISHIFPSVPRIPVTAHVDSHVFPPRPLSLSAISFLNPQRLRPGSWADTIDQITPGQTLAQMRYQRGLIDDAAAEKDTASSLKKIFFKSCGYVYLPLDFSCMDQRSVAPRFMTELPDFLKALKACLRTCMMTTDDLSLGTIIQDLSSVELEVLEQGFGLFEGWGDNPKRYINREDGFFDGGTGRFSGIIVS